MRTGLFFTDREIELLEIITEQEVKSFSDKNCLLCIEYQGIRDILIKKGVEEK